MCRAHSKINTIIINKKAVKWHIGGYTLGEWGPKNGRYACHYIGIHCINTEMKFGSYPSTWEQWGYILFWGKAEK